MTALSSTVGVCSAQPTDPLALAIDALIEEARLAMAEKAVPTDEPDLVSRHEFNASAWEPDAVARAITSPQHEHPFIDAYVRWQLTSVGVDLPEWSPETFLAMLNNLPRLIENPRASAQHVSIFERVAAVGTLSSSDLDQLRDMLQNMQRNTLAAEMFNVPALELRAWITDRLPRHRTEHLLMLIEECAATIEGGWPTRSIKTRISRTFSSASTNPTLTDAERRAILAELPRLTATNCRFVKSVTFLGDGSVRVRFSTVAILDRDIENWTERLLGNATP